MPTMALRADPMVLVIDNYDSFTYNLVHYLVIAGAEVRVIRHDAISVEDALALNPAGVVISPGPGGPDAAGISVALIRRLPASTPVLGVCLGHQCIAVAFGGRITAAQELMHGKTSLVAHDEQGVFAHTPSPLRATRYHSLVVDRAALPACLTCTAWVAGSAPEPDIMGLRHRDRAVEGVQFHPEAILTEHGQRLMSNFVVRAREQRT